jgi:uncharacterized protein YaiL (DUF2058 family)
MRCASDEKGADVGIREELLKAGLVSKKQAKQVDAAARKQEHEIKRNKEAARAAQQAKDEEIRRVQEEADAKREADIQLNLEREALKQQREQALRATQLVRSNRLNDPRAQTPYYFVEGGTWVRRVDADAYQQEMLARGKFAIARLHSEVDEFAIVPSHTADTLASIAPELIVARHAPLDDAEEVKVE